MLKLTVKKNRSESNIPPVAATRPKQPESHPETDSDLGEGYDDTERNGSVKSQVHEEVNRARPERRLELQLDRSRRTGSEELPSATFCRPANTNVNPRNALSGKSTQTGRVSDRDRSKSDDIAFAPGLTRGTVLEVCAPPEEPLASPVAWGGRRSEDMVFLFSTLTAGDGESTAPRATRLGWF